jgi:hypothetical protein
MMREGILLYIKAVKKYVQSCAPSLSVMYIHNHHCNYNFVHLILLSLCHSIVSTQNNRNPRREIKKHKSSWTSFISLKSDFSKWAQLILFWTRANISLTFMYKCKQNKDWLESKICSLCFKKVRWNLAFLIRRQGSMLRYL